MSSAREWIECLRLRPHPEGGYYRETHRSREIIPLRDLPAGFTSDRACLSVIYFLLAGDDFSAFHRIKQDEVWHFYAGSSLTLHVIDPAGSYIAVQLGLDLKAGQEPQAVIKAGCWFGATVDDSRSYSLVGCAVAPAFDFEDFELPARAKLLKLFPQHREIIEKLTRPNEETVSGKLGNGE